MKNKNYSKDKTEIKTTQKLIEGPISISGKGTGYVRTKDFKDSIEVDHAHLNTALQGDTVLCKLHSFKKDKAQTGEVVKIIKRSKVGFAGIIEKEEGIYFFVPSDPKMYTDIIIPENKLNHAKAGQKVFVKISEWHDPLKSPIGEVAQVLGQPGDNNVEMTAIALEKGFEADFPKKVEEEVSKFKHFQITEKDLKDRRDLRGVTTFTIDPEDAKDFDDALSFQKLPNNEFEIGVHIADVSHFVRPNTALDDEAYRRGTSVYLVDRTIPMLPEILSNELCSLKPFEDKLTMSAIFTIDRKANVKKSWFGKTIIHSQKRFTYEEAQKVIDQKQGHFYQELHELNILAKHLKEKRFAEGAIALDQDEVKFVLDENGVPLKVTKKIRQDTNKLIEEFMLLANRRVAEEIARGNEKVFVYRIHDLPEAEKINELGKFLKKFGYHLKISKEGVTAKALNDLIKSLEGKVEQDVIKTAITRSMQKAIYSTKNIGHYGLAFTHYTHFTSPIRRYPDTVVHRLLELYLKQGRISKEKWHEYQTVSNTSSAREKEAQEAERASIKYKQVEYMQSRIGQSYDGLITGVTDRGLFVEEKETKCEGMIRLRDLGDDYYFYDEKEFAVIGKKTKKKFRIGDKLKIKVKNADLKKKIIDYVPS